MPYWLGISDKSSPDGPLSSRMQVVQTDVDHVNDVWRECVRPTKHGLLRVSSLKALLEAATVRNAAENAGDELGIVR